MTHLGSSDIVAIAALIISLAAFFTTILQVLQQYLASAEGFRRCAPSVMGLWHVGTHRKFRRRELRFEVVFETPVLFLAPPTNKRGPIEKREIYNIDGTNASYDGTNTMRPGEIREYNVSTADDEQATWVTLLAVLQRNEAESRKWEEKYRHSARGNKYEAPKYTIVTQMQKKTRSYDFMPDSVTKPYATTTISHLVEMVGMMGMHWKAFDELKGNVRAEGNGLMLTSTQVHGLGLMATFSKTGRSEFESGRIIPNHEIKELVFGCVPTILGEVIEVGKADISRTLLDFKCSRETIKMFEARNNRGNIPSVTFELIALLAKPIRIRSSNFKMLPNPTGDRWPGKLAAIDWPLVMEEFQSQLKQFLERPTLSIPHTGPYLSGIQNTLVPAASSSPSSPTRPPLTIPSAFPPQSRRRASSRGSRTSAASGKVGFAAAEPETIAAPETTTEEINPLITTITGSWEKIDAVWKISPGSIQRASAISTDLLVDKKPDIDIDLREALHDALDDTQKALDDVTICSKNDIIAVVGAHIHAILKTSDAIIDEVSDISAIPLYVSRRPSLYPDQNSEAPSSTPSSRFMAAYFAQILPFITDTLLDGDIPTDEIKAKRSSIWMTLIFRMICWFMLHSFGEGDVGMLRSDMKGSRMPVYIG